MEVQGVRSGSTTTTSTKGSRVSKDDFLKILISQIKYQDPLEPMKPDQFLSQLSQLTQVEQLQQMGESIDAMRKSLEGSGTTQWLSSIGKKMLVDSTTVTKGDEILLAPQGDFDNVTLTLKRADGSMQEVHLSKGDDLLYKYDGAEAVSITATAYKAGKQVACEAKTFRAVMGVQISESGPMMVSGSGETYSAAQIKQIRQ